MKGEDLSWEGEDEKKKDAHNLRKNSFGGRAGSQEPNDPENQLESSQSGGGGNEKEGGVLWGGRSG